MADTSNLRHILDQARSCIRQAQPHQALEYLRSIQHEMEDLTGSSLWAEHELVYACALAAMNEPAARTAFDEALRRIEGLSEPDLPLTMSAHADYAKYLAGRQSTKSARQHYQAAERIANALEREDCVAHFQMCIERIGLQESKSPHLDAFRKLQEAARDYCTELQKREAWIHYVDEFGEIEPQLVATRRSAEASVEYFRGVLSEIKRGRK
jgi:hypothetical protein